MFTSLMPLDEVVEETATETLVDDTDVLCRMQAFLPDRDYRALLILARLDQVRRSQAVLSAIESFGDKGGGALTALKSVAHYPTTDDWNSTKDWIAANMSGISFALREFLGGWGLTIEIIMRCVTQTKLADPNQTAVVLPAASLDTMARALVQLPSTLTKLTKLKVPTTAAELMKLKVDIAHLTQQLMFVGVVFDPSGTLVVKELPVPHSGTLKALGYKNNSLNVIALNLKSAASAMKTEQRGFLSLMNGLSKRISDFAKNAERMQSASQLTEDQKNTILEGSALVMDTIMTLMSRYTATLRLGIEQCMILEPLYSGHKVALTEGE